MLISGVPYLCSVYEDWDNQCVVDISPIHDVETLDQVAEYGYPSDCEPSTVSHNGHMLYPIEVLVNVQYWTSKGNKFYNTQNRFFWGQLGARITLREVNNIQNQALDIFSLHKNDPGTQLPLKNLF